MSEGVTFFLKVLGAVSAVWIYAKLSKTPFLPPSWSRSISNKRALFIIVLILAVPLAVVCIALFLVIKQ